MTDELDPMSETRFTRRVLLKRAAGAAALAAAGPLVALPALGSTGTRPMRVTTMVTPDEIWYGKNWLGEFPPPPEGWRRMLDFLKEVGHDCVHWRVNEPATVAYRSRLEAPAMHRFPYTSQAKLDTFGVGVEHARKIGLAIYPYGKVDAEGWGDTSMGAFVTSNPHLRRVGRDRKPFDANLGWAFPEVIEYKLALVREWLSYRPDGVALAFDTMGLNTDNFVGTDGAALGGYETPAVEGFKQKYGKDPFEIPNDDPDWIKYRMDFKTAFVRGVRRMIDEDFPGTNLVAYVPGPNQTIFSHNDGTRGWPVCVGDPRAARLLDVDTWVSERLVDGLCIFYSHDPHYKEGDRGVVNRSSKYRPARPNDVTEQIRWFRNLTGDKVDVIFSLYSYGISADNLVDCAAAAREAGAGELIFDEFSPIQKRQLWPAVRKAIRLAHGGDSR